MNPRKAPETEKRTLSECRAGDDIRIPFHVYQGLYGRILLTKVKRISDKIVQIKYRQTIGGTKIHKADLPANLAIEKYLEPYAAPEPRQTVLPPITSLDLEATPSLTGPPVDSFSLESLVFAPNGGVSLDDHLTLQQILAQPIGLESAIASAVLMSGGYLKRR